MKSVKSFLMFFLLSLASISIIFDWSDYRYDVTFKLTNKAVADKHEEIPYNTFQSYRRSYFLSPHKQPNKTENTESKCDFDLDTTKSYNRVINVRCAVKSYLYLLQLF